MRYLLRPPSTPWITFDKQEPEIGALLASSRSSVSSEAGFFPETAPVEPLAPAAEPSNVVVSSDIQDSTPVVAHADPFASELDETHDSVAIPVASPRRIVAGVGAALALTALIAGTAWSVGGHGKAAVASAASTAVEAKAAAMPAEPVPPQLDIPAPPPTSEPAEPAAKPEKKGFGRLVVRGAAKNNRVYLDGKLLLGQGQRTFMVFCGDHTIAVGKKADARDVDVPCNGELVVSK